MNVIRQIYYFFSLYVNSDERAVGLFFAGLSEHSNQPRTRARLGNLLQRNIAVINLWSEYKYKGYKYLRKSHRKSLYKNLQIISDDFDRFQNDNKRSGNKILAHIHTLAPNAQVTIDKVIILHALMDYFSPTRGIYQYRESSSFGRLLRDPTHEMLVGDCNQIVTLYIYLYSQYFDVHDLQIRLLPGHVALHYEGIDIEATNGTFMNYSDRKDNPIMPIDEIVSVNLLDTTDSYLKTHDVAAEDFLQASRFAYILSHERNIVKHNLDAAYNSLITSLMKRNNYKSALNVARASRDHGLIGLVSHNGAVYHMQHGHFDAARRFAKDATKRTQLLRDSHRAEGVHYYQDHKYHDAIKSFNHISDEPLLRRCYEALFFDEQKKLGTTVTSESIKNHVDTIKRMKQYAKKSKNKKLIDHANTLYKHL